MVRDVRAGAREAVLLHEAPVAVCGPGSTDSDGGGRARRLPESPAAFMTPDMRSTEILDRFGPNGKRAAASSPTDW
jgi:hypothetical protein